MMTSDLTPAIYDMRVMIIICCTCLSFVIQECQTEMVSYLSIVRPYIEYVDPTYMANVSLSTRRYNRTDPYHYITLDFTTLLRLDKHCAHSISFYEMISASTKQPIIELQYDYCDWADNDPYFGAIAREAYLKIPKAERPMPEFKCPFMPGRYLFKDLKAPLYRMPFTLPFQNGRGYYKLSCKNKVIAKSRADLQIITKAQDKPAKH